MNGFVWISQDETCQVHLDKYSEYVVLSTHIDDYSHSHMSLRMSRRDFLVLAGMMRDCADEMEEEGI